MEEASNKSIFDFTPGIALYGYLKIIFYLINNKFSILCIAGISSIFPILFLTNVENNSGHNGSECPEFAIELAKLMGYCNIICFFLFLLIELIKKY